ncbi:MAG: translation initiation factor 6 (aeIF-6) [Nitrososphaeraceae archaeon]|nr:translation initiation factor 6 (aeIF-6) [Nitrososphaeraceae archaeon]
MHRYNLLLEISKSIGSYAHFNKNLIFPNIGLFVRANDRIIIVPFGFAETKTTKLMEYLQVEDEVCASVGGTRLIGPMTVMNNNGILVPSIASDEEIEILRKASGLNVERLKSKFTAIGNLISTNDNGALLSPLFEGEIDQQVQDILGVPVYSMTVGGFIQTGSMVRNYCKFKIGNCWKFD